MDPWGSAAEGIGVHECWSLFKSRLLRAQEQAFPKERKSSKQCKGLPWLSRDLLGEFRQKERVQTLEAQIGNTGGLEFGLPVWHCREKIHAIKARLEFKLTSAVKDKKGFLK